VQKRLVDVKPIIDEIDPAFGGLAKHVRSLLAK